jgi:hypothetical protein
MQIKAFVEKTKALPASQRTADAAATPSPVQAMVEPKRVPLTYQGRKLEIRALVVAGDWQIWLFENDQKNAMEQARAEIEAEELIVPVVREWKSGR